MVCGKVLFPLFWSFLGRKPPCCDVIGVNWGRGGALHVSKIVVDISWTRWSIVVHAVCHWSLLRWLFVSKVVSSFIWSVLVSKNFVVKLSRFSWGMGFRSLCGFGVGCGIGRVSSLFGGICNETGE